MARATAIGEGVIVYLDESGKQSSIPLSALYFEGTEVRTTLSPPVSPALTAWLGYLVAQGRIKPGPAPTPGDAVVLTAASGGAQGNNITIQIASNTTTMPASVDITVTEADAYTDLSMTDLVTRLGGAGTGGVAGSQPGLLRVQPIATGAPAPAVPSSGSATTAVAGVASWQVVGPTPTSTTAAFVLSARGPGADATGATMTIALSPGSATGKFNLNVTWSNTVLAVGPGDLATLATKLQPLAYAVTVSQPTVNTVAAPFQLPRPGTFTLGGGADVAPATPASATLLASA